MSYLIIDNTNHTTGFYLVTKAIFNKIKAIPFDYDVLNRNDNIYKQYVTDIDWILNSDQGLRRGVEYHCLNKYDNLFLGAVEGVFAINAG